MTWPPTWPRDGPREIAKDGGRVTKPRLRLAAVFVAATSAPAVSLGFDVGAPTFLGEDDEGPRFHFETAFVSQERDLIVSSNRLRGARLAPALRPASAPRRRRSVRMSTATSLNSDGFSMPHHE